MAHHTITVGNVEMVSLTDGWGDGDPTEVFAASAIEEWRADFPDLLDEKERIHPRFGSVAIRSGGKLAIVDTGLQAPDGTLLEEMRRKGIDRESVDLVVLTHLHPDHVGWNLTDGRPTFPGARYLVSRLDWEYWTSPGVLEDAPHVGQQALPLHEMGLLDLMEGEHRITDQMTAVPTPGHTPGHVSIEVSSGGERGYILGDVVHSPAQAHRTEWSPVFDVDPDVSVRTRHAVLDRLEREGTLVSAGHFPDPGFGRFVRARGRRLWQGV